MIKKKKVVLPNCKVASHEIVRSRSLKCSCASAELSLLYLLFRLLVFLENTIVVTGVVAMNGCKSMRMAFNTF